MLNIRDLLAQCDRCKLEAPSILFLTALVYSEHLDLAESQIVVILDDLEEGAVDATLAGDREGRGAGGVHHGTTVHLSNVHLEGGGGVAGENGDYSAVAMINYETI